MKKYLVIVVFALTATLLAGCASKDGLTRQQKADMLYFKKQVKEYKKEGWKMPYGPPMEYCIGNAYKLTNELDEKGVPKYVYGEALAIGENYDAAHFMAMNLSKIELASKIESEIIQMIETRNCIEIEKESQASSYKTLSGCTILVAQKLSRVITPIDLYRNLPDGNVEVRIMSFYDHQLAMDIFKQTLRDELEKKVIENEELEQKAEELSKQLEGILKF